MEAVLVRRWSMADRCLWPAGCAQDQTDDSGEFCYYHFKLVEGQIDLRVHTPKPSVSEAADTLARAGGVPGAVARTAAEEPRIPYDRKLVRKGKIRNGSLRLPRSARGKGH